MGHNVVWAENVPPRHPQASARGFHAAGVVMPLRRDMQAREVNHLDVPPGNVPAAALAELPSEVYDLVLVQHLRQPRVPPSIDTIAIGNTNGIELAVGQRPVEISLL